MENSNRVQEVHAKGSELPELLWRVLVSAEGIPFGKTLNSHIENQRIAEK